MKTSPSNSAAEVLTTDEVTFSVTIVRQQPMDFARLIWPMVMY